jgi:hypothetical protein
MDGKKGRFVFFFNHGEKAAEVEFAEELERAAGNAREIMIGEKRKVEGKRFAVKTEVPALGVRIYRIDF